MARLLADGYDDICLSKFTSGNGTTEPKGILTAATAQTSTETVVGTDGASRRRISTQCGTTSGEVPASRIVDHERRRDDEHDPAVR